MPKARCHHHHLNNVDSLVMAVTIVTFLLLQLLTEAAVSTSVSSTSSSTAPPLSSSLLSSQLSYLYNNENSILLLRGGDDDDDDDDDPSSPSSPVTGRSVILIVGSANADTFLPVERLPTEGENLTLLPNNQPIVDVPGGKGCTQAVAVSRLLLMAGDDVDDVDTSTSTSSTSVMDGPNNGRRVVTRFVGQLGHDDAGTILLTALHTARVDTTYCGKHDGVPTGRGYVFIVPSSGSVSAVVSGGTNTAGWVGWEEAWDVHRQRMNVQPTTMEDKTTTTRTTTTTVLSNIEQHVHRILEDVDCILLQREVPEYVNLLVASCAREKEQRRRRSISLEDDGCGSNDTQDHTNNNNNNDNDDEDDDGILIFLDIGGEDRPISSEMLRLCDYVTPNASELKRLVESTLRIRDGPLPDRLSSSSSSQSDMTTQTTPATTVDDDENDVTVRYARILQNMGARNVLVTRGSSGSTLVTAHGRDVIHQRAIMVPNKTTQQQQQSLDEGDDDDDEVVDDDDINNNSIDQSDGGGGCVVDETGAGDCFRAAFAVALIEGHSIRQSLQFASAAGSCSVQVNGAVPSAPTRSQVLHRLLGEGAVLDVPRGDGQQQQQQQHKQQPLDGIKNVQQATQRSTSSHPQPTFLPRGGHQSKDVDDDEDTNDGKSSMSDDETTERFPFLIGSRLNSMKDRPDLWKDGALQTPYDYVKRQAKIGGLTCVDFNYPQHFDSYWTVQDARAALEDTGLVAGAVCLRYPPRFARGAMNHPDEGVRREAMAMTKQAAETAIQLGCNEVVIWSAYDGYDYPFQVDYDDKWDQLVRAFQELCDTYPTIKFSLEYKPTDENTRFFTVPSTGAALLLVDDIDRPNMGLTLDVGHMLMSGENPGQSIAMVGRRNKLFGIQLNDGYTRLAAEDGLMFGSCHPTMALEVMYQLRRTNFDGHLYFDTFPQRSDPIQEAEYNIRQVKRFWYASSNNIAALDETRLRTIMDNHDAIGALELVNEALLYGGGKGGTDQLK